MASISFQTPEKMNDENALLPRTPHTPNSHKVQDLGRTSSQKKARQIFDSLRGLKSRGRLNVDMEDAGGHSAGPSSPVRRKNATWDFLGTIRTKRSGEFGTPENERPLTTTPLKAEPQINEASKLLPRRRKSLVNILGSISNKVSPRRSTTLRENTLEEEILPNYCEEDVFAEKLAKELIELKANNPSPLHKSESDGQSRFPQERLGGSCNLEANFNTIIESLQKLRQSEDLPNSRVGYDADSWTSQAQTLQSVGSNEQLTSQSPTTDIDEEESKTPDSYLCSIIKSFDDYNNESFAVKGKGVTISPSPSPDKLQPTKPIDFLKDSSPDVIPERSGPSNQFMDTLSSKVCQTNALATPERICRQGTWPMITIREVASDSNSSSTFEDQIAPSPPTWQAAAKSRNAMLESRARLPYQPDRHYIQKVDAPFMNSIKEWKSHSQSLQPTPPRADESDHERIALNIKQTVNKMTKNLHLSSFSEETIEDWDEVFSKEETSDKNLDNISKTVEDIHTKTIEKVSGVTMIRKNISSFTSRQFLDGAIHVRYPQTEVKWRHMQYFPTGRLAISDIRKRNKGEYSDTISYCLEETCIYVHLWGKVPKPESELSVRVKYPETKTRWARTKIYDSGDLAMADMDQENRGEFSDIRYDASERCFYIYAWGDVVEAPKRGGCDDYQGIRAGLIRTQTYGKNDLALADLCEQSRESLSDVGYNASERRFQSFTLDEAMDELHSCPFAGFQKSETERKICAGSPELTQTQIYESKPGFSQVGTDKNSTFVYSAPEQSSRVEAQTAGIEPIYRTREPVWRPTLSPLGDRDESDQDLPDFSDLENEFQLVTIRSPESSSLSVKSQESEAVGEDTSGSNDMSLCVEAGTPRKSGQEFITELFMANDSDRPAPLLRGSKQILQYLDSFGGGNCSSNSVHAENDLQSNRKTATKIWAESEDAEEMHYSIEPTPDSVQAMIDDLFAQATHHAKLDDSSDDGSASFKIEVVEEETRKGSKSSLKEEHKLSRFLDNHCCGISGPNEVSKNREEIASETKGAKDHIIFDFGNDTIHRRERSNAISGEGPSVAVWSNKLDESIYILPIDNIDLYEENAGCGDPKSPCPTEIDGNIAPFSTDAELTVLVPEPIDTVTVTNHKANNHLSSLDLAKANFDNKEETANVRPGLWANTCTKEQNKCDASACNVSSIFGKLGLETALAPAISKIEEVATSDNKKDEPTDFPKGKENIIRNSTLRVETVSQAIIDNEVLPQLNTRIESKRVPTLVNIFHSRGMKSPSSARPFLDTCSSPLQSISTPKRVETYTPIQNPRIVTPSGKIYSPAQLEEDKKVSNPIQRVQTPGSGLEKQRKGRAYFSVNMSVDDADDEDNVDLSGDETEISEGFGEKLERMRVMAEKDINTDEVPEERNVIANARTHGNIFILKVFNFGKDHTRH
ncbi:uncharacterized protein Bfra_007877 [Botrytis fragariae]|uniref:Uncharacterized protein n=1 Tax=Botrytis fragariae TaxID=1964551 RepID=A0A8H6APR5_9HELO|nr:uncharacterized protein Bfra_007877 [Botrytis fragariae]KAF5871362.1 hypothetical protein Bfra_007877 [Botrytis fragariae]